MTGSNVKESKSQQMDKEADVHDTKLFPTTRSIILESSTQFTGTVAEHQCHTPSRDERRFLYSNHLPKEFLEQMIPHLKALI